MVPTYLHFFVSILSFQVSKDSSHVSHGETDTAQARSSRNEYLNQNGRAPAGHMTRRNTYDNVNQFTLIHLYIKYRTLRRQIILDQLKHFLSKQKLETVIIAG